MLWFTFHSLANLSCLTSYFHGKHVNMMLFRQVKKSRPTYMLNSEPGSWLAWRHCLCHSDRSRSVQSFDILWGSIKIKGSGSEPVQKLWRKVLKRCKNLRACNSKKKQIITPLSWRVDTYWRRSFNAIWGQRSLSAEMSKVGTGARGVTMPLYRGPSRCLLDACTLHRRIDIMMVIS